MDNKPKKKFYMDMVAAPKRPGAKNPAARPSVRPASPARPGTPVSAPRPAVASVRPGARPAAAPSTPRPESAPRPAQHIVSSRDPFKPRPVVDSALIARQAAARRPMGDFRATPAAAPTTPRPESAPRPAATARPAEPRIIQQTTVRSISATPEKVEEFEFGVIEDLTPSTPSALHPVDHSSDYLHVEPPAETFAKDSARPEKKSNFFKKSHPANPKSPFLSVSVPKRPLSASMPTGAHVPVTEVPAPLPPAPAVKRKKKNVPFIVIVILSVLLGVTLGALVYFILPH